ncbi:hypothetical protein [Chitinophaga filiformis]|uniref:Uncharacterized protein n=1 Tax=Chitinophaga filiformis TaxID=104663 RepID=A0A1G8D6M2_CHIFI|nr:hypothetical protein [Chitinophaga filiformis]SDH53397.1 hypothetical protein SAMN04488121_1148 [Chitinophaga filiformis]
MELTPGTDIGQHVIALLTNMEAVMINIQAILTRMTEGSGNAGQKTSIEPHTGTED